LALQHLVLFNIWNIVLSAVEWTQDADLNLNNTALTNAMLLTGSVWVASLGSLYVGYSVVHDAELWRYLANNIGERLLYMYVQVHVCWGYLANNARTR